VISGKSRWNLIAEVIIQLQLDEQENCLVQKFEKIKVGWVKIPSFLYKYFTDRKHFLAAGPGMPFDLKIRNFMIDQGKIEINPNFPGGRGIRVNDL
jgi:hypothetical protein